jgi:hypothetical protein
MLPPLVWISGLPKKAGNQGLNRAAVTAVSGVEDAVRRMSLGLQQCRIVKCASIPSVAIAPALAG